MTGMVFQNLAQSLWKSMILTPPPNELNGIFWKIKQIRQYVLKILLISFVI